MALTLPSQQRLSKASTSSGKHRERMAIPSCQVWAQRLGLGVRVYGAALVADEWSQCCRHLFLLPLATLCRYRCCRPLHCELPGVWNWSVSTDTGLLASGIGSLHAANGFANFSLEQFQIAECRRVLSGYCWQAQKKINPCPKQPRYKAESPP